MERFDRELQREILLACIRAYPGDTSSSILPPIITSANDDKLAANIIYLSEHGLLVVSPQATDDEYILANNLRITCRGIDFMRNDGGLTSVLNVQTIKIHRDTVVVLEDLIAISSLTSEQQIKARSRLAEMSNDALSSVVQGVTAAGLSLLLK